MEYFIDKRLYISNGKKGRGIYANEYIPLPFLPLLI